MGPNLITWGLYCVSNSLKFVAILVLYCILLDFKSLWVCEWYNCYLINLAENTPTKSKAERALPLNASKAERALRLNAFKEQLKTQNRLRTRPVVGVLLNFPVLPSISKRGVGLKTAIKT